MPPETPQIEENLKMGNSISRSKFTLLASVYLLLASLAIFSRVATDLPLSPLTALIIPFFYIAFVWYILFSDKVFSIKILAIAGLFIAGMTSVLIVMQPSLGMLVLDDGMGLGPIIFVFKIIFYTVVLTVLTLMFTKLRISLEGKGGLSERIYGITASVVFFVAIIFACWSYPTVVRCGVASCRDLENITERAIALHSITACNNFVEARRDGSSRYSPFGGDEPRLALWIEFYDFFPAPLRKNMMGNDTWYRDDFFKKNGYDFANDCYYKELISEHPLTSKEEVSLCEAIPNDTSRGLCRNTIAVAVKDSSLCTRFEETGFNNGGEIALESCMTKAGSSEQLDKLFETDDNGFLLNVDLRFLHKDEWDLFYDYEKQLKYVQQVYKRNQSQSYRVIMTDTLQGTTTRTYTGIVLQEYYGLSPSKERMVFLNKKNELCVIDIVSKKKQCISPKVGEFFYKGAYKTIDISWVDESSFRYKVFGKDPINESEERELRADTFVLSSDLLRSSETAASNQTDFDPLITYDEYSFPTSVHMEKYTYNEPILLYEKNGYKYVQLVNETAGAKPIAEISPSLERRYLGITLFPDIDKLSPDKHKYTYIGYGDERVCIVQISPKSIKCIQPASPNETYVARGGDYDVPYVDGKWIDNNTIEFSVFAKEASSYLPGVHDTSHPLRKETFTFK